jgi:hypothetical protein
MKEMGNGKLEMRNSAFFSATKWEMGNWNEEFGILFSNQMMKTLSVVQYKSEGRQQFNPKVKVGSSLIQK